MVAQAYPEPSCPIIKRHPLWANPDPEVVAGDVWADSKKLEEMSRK
jgi:hypothetical protein